MYRALPDPAFIIVEPHPVAAINVLEFSLKVRQSLKRGSRTPRKEVLYTLIMWGRRKDKEPKKTGTVLAEKDSVKEEKNITLTWKALRTTISITTLFFTSSYSGEISSDFTTEIGTPES